MKILHFITDLEIGGAETRMLRLIEYGNSNLFQHTVVSLMDEGTYGIKLKNMEVPIETLDMTYRKPWRFLPWKSSVLIKKYNPDIIVGWMYHGNLVAIISSMYKRKKIPVLWNVSHSIYNLKQEKLFTRFIIRLLAKYSKYTTKILYNSYTSLQQHTAIGYSADRSMFITCGFDCEKFSPSAEARQKIRTSLNISDNVLLVGIVGRYHPMKGYDIFLRSALQILEYNTSVKFVLVGRNVEWSNPSLAQIVPAEKRAHFFMLGERNDVNTIMPAFDIAVSSSRSESSANVIGEAMACGVPFVVTDVGDSAKIVGDTGLVVPPCDNNALAEAIKTLIKLSRSERNKLGVRARERIINEYSLHTMVSQYEKIFCEVTNVSSQNK